MTKKIRKYSELKQLATYEERLEYLRIEGSVGIETFGFDRIFNQKFYRSKEWRKVRNQVIARDNGCDLGIDGYDIYSNILIHHMNPISIEDIQNSTEYLLNPDYLITTNLSTHNDIHYGIKDNFYDLPKERSMNDTCPWRK